MSDWFDQIIEEAMRRGQFDNLPGKGKPLKFDQNPHEDPEMRLAHKILNDGGFELPWMYNRKEIEAEIETATKNLTQAAEDYRAAGQAHWAQGEWEAAVSKFRARVTAVNKRIDNYNLSVPAQIFQRLRVEADQIIHSLIPHS